jgi:phage terminase large subunit-like protein
MDLSSLLDLTEAQLADLPRTYREEAAKEIIRRLGIIRQENQLEFYTPVSDRARAIHLSTAKEVITTGGNRSSKTDTHLAEGAIQLTGVIPRSLVADYPRIKIRPPVRVRIVCTSLIGTWDTVIRPKLQYWQWNGAGDPGSELGHWGWIPKRFLIGGSWSQSWSEKHRVLTLTNGSTMQIMAYHQEVEAFSGSSIHLVLHDEGPPQAIYRENKMRTIDVRGRIMTAMTPPDDTSASWDAAWVYDDLYCRGLPGPDKDPNIDAFTLFTEENKILSKEEIDIVTHGLTPEQKEVRLRGAFMHLGGRIYSTFTDRVRDWCFTCVGLALAHDNKCLKCQNRTVPLCHVIEPFEIPSAWPTVFVIDPHPRKANAMAWYSISPYDEAFQVAELESEKIPTQVKLQVEDMERSLGLNVIRRLMDPNMGKAPAGTGSQRVRTVQEEYAECGLLCDLADDNRDTARTRIRELLQPNARTEQPSIKIFNRCRKTIFQMNRYSWDEHSRYSATEKNPKALPRPLHDDFPTALGYFANGNFVFSSGARRRIQQITSHKRVY